MIKAHKTLLTRIAISFAVSLAYQRGLHSERGWPDALLSSLLMAAAYLFGCWLMARRTAKLTKRMQAATDQAPWSVSLNGIPLGEISDAEYAAMQLDVFRNAGVAWSQAANIVSSTCSTALKLLIVGPCLTFWLVVIGAIFEPGMLIESARQFSTAEPAALAAMVRSLMQNLLPIFLLLVLVFAAAGYRFGFRNCYSDAVGRLLGEHFKTPAEGRFSVYRAWLPAERATR